MLMAKVVLKIENAPKKLTQNSLMTDFNSSGRNNRSGVSALGLSTDSRNGVIICLIFGREPVKIEGDRLLLSQVSGATGTQQHWIRAGACRGARAQRGGEAGK